jgi:hypothetical protein
MSVTINTVKQMSSDSGLSTSGLMIEDRPATQTWGLRPEGTEMNPEVMATCESLGEFVTLMSGLTLQEIHPRLIRTKQDTA